MLSLSSPAFRDGHIEKRFGNLGPKEKIDPSVKICNIIIFVCKLKLHFVLSFMVY